MSGTASELSAAAIAEQRVAAVRDTPAGRAGLLEEIYRGPGASGQRHLPYRRAARSFMSWEVRRGILNAPEHPRPGSAWWRAINERMLRDGCEAQARLQGHGGAPPSPTVTKWLGFMSAPTAARWWIAHNASVVGAYVDHRDLAAREHPAERFFMNVVLLRVLYAHALIGAPRLALGAWSPAGRMLGDPRLGMAGVFLSLRRVLPDRYPLGDHDVAAYRAAEHRVGRVMDYAVIAPRLQALYAWSAESLEAPQLLTLIDEGRPAYAWPPNRSDVWSADHLSWRARAFGRLVRARQ